MQSSATFRRGGGGAVWPSVSSLCQMPSSSFRALRGKGCEFLQIPLLEPPPCSRVEPLVTLRVSRWSDFAAGD